MEKVSSLLFVEKNVCALEQKDLAHLFTFTETSYYLVLHYPYIYATNNQQYQGKGEKEMMLDYHLFLD